MLGFDTSITKNFASPLHLGSYYKVFYKICVRITKEILVNFFFVGVFRFTFRKFHLKPTRRKQEHVRGENENR